NEITEIVKLQFNNIAKILEKNQVKISATENALQFIAREGFDPQFGARPVKRVIQKKILNELSKKILSGNVLKDSEIVIDVEKN
ncbi:MAG: hypothetical protein K8R74_12810, partial [Bacteroidales bacterium]|nr:hypothetical protein [Bacteroidales bacterium]